MSCDAAHLLVVDCEQMGCEGPGGIGDVDLVTAVRDPGSGVVRRHGKYLSRRISEICIER